MPEHDALVLSYVHLAGFPRAGEALHTLKKVASLVKPIMRARNWKVRELAEFYPEQNNLLGLNVNKGMKICLRLRHAGDRNQFMPIENVVDTMLHELSHIVHGPHDSKFHALWDQLRDEHQGLALKGYTGEGFLSEGRRLGGARIPPREARRLAREAAEKRRVRPLGTGAGKRLGGAAPRPGEDIRRVIADAAERRNQTLKGCGTDQLSESQIRNIADTATRNGFRTQADEDAANDAAIAQALWELVQEDEQAKYGSSYIPPTADNPTGNGGGAVMPTGGGPSTSGTRPAFGSEREDQAVKGLPLLRCVWDGAACKDGTGDGEPSIQISKTFETASCRRLDRKPSKRSTTRYCRLSDSQDGINGNSGNSGNSIVGTPDMAV
ncbi:hypothetical protein ACJ41O_002183 [Fusarium nematophilum]